MAFLYPHIYDIHHYSDEERANVIRLGAMLEQLPPERFLIWRGGIA
jgi:hypothetical protein